ncbi:MAG: hypothetical protein ACI4JZ_04650 [Oscillospiraceae bacterium]
MVELKSWHIERKVSGVENVFYALGTVYTLQKQEISSNLDAELTSSADLYSPEQPLSVENISFLQ